MIYVNVFCHLHLHTQRSILPFDEILLLFVLVFQNLNLLVWHITNEICHHIPNFLKVCINTFNFSVNNTLAHRRGNTSLHSTNSFTYRTGIHTKAHTHIHICFNKHVKSTICEGNKELEKKKVFVDVILDEWRYA